MRIVVAVDPLRVELVNGITAGFAREQFLDGPGDNRMNRGTSRFQNINGLVRMSVVDLVEHIAKVGESHPPDRR
jgi:hypothetical protein